MSRGGPLPRRRKDLAARLAALRSGENASAEARSPGPSEIEPRGAESPGVGSVEIGPGTIASNRLERSSPGEPSRGAGGGPKIAPPAPDAASFADPDRVLPAEPGRPADRPASSRPSSDDDVEHRREQRRRYSRIRSLRKAGASPEVDLPEIRAAAPVAKSNPLRRGPDPETLAVDEWIDPATAPEDHFAPDFPAVVPFGPEVLYLDLETTGLGAHECVALGGTLRPEGTGVRLRQHFAFDPAQERTALERLLEDLDSVTTLVTYNGRTFDLPFLKKRLAWHRLPALDPDLDHLDLLVGIRKRYRKEWGSCSLGEAERRLLGKERTGPDVPGREVPLRFLDVKEGAPVELLTPVTHHNRIDLTSLVALHRWWVEGMREPPR